MEHRRSVGILVYDEVEVLHMAAPFEIFSVAGTRRRGGLFSVFTVARRYESFRVRNNLSLTARYDFGSCPTINVLVVPGGPGARTAIECSSMLEWVRRVASATQAMISIGSGSLILAKAGLLRRRSATTHYLSLGLLAELEPTCKVETRRLVQSGAIATAATVSAGIDASLQVLARLAGPDIARETAQDLDYAW